MPHDPPALATRSSDRLPYRASLLAVTWLAVAFVFVAQNGLSSAGRPEGFQWRRDVWFELEYWSIFFASTPLFFFVARRFRIAAGESRRNLAIHAVAALTFALMQPLAASALQYATLAATTGTDDPVRVKFLMTLPQRYPLLAVIAFWKYAVVVGIYYAFDYHRKYQLSALHSARLEAQLTGAQLGALRMQLQPHFLFNALHSAALLTLTAPERAHDVLVRLADLLRETLDSAGTATVPFASELAFIDCYLGIERVRFEDRMSVRYEIAQEAENWMVPNLILQPLVENAIHHAFSPHSATRTLLVRAYPHDQLLYLEVEDDGPGLPSGWTFAIDAGTGLTNVQSRVNLANGVERPIEFAGGAHGGLRVRIALPRRLAA